MYLVENKAFTVKTKCISFSKKSKDTSKLAPVVLDGRCLPWVTKVNHLGSILESDSSMKSDISAKKGQFVGKVNSLLQEFHSLLREFHIPGQRELLTFIKNF